MNGSRVADAACAAGLLIFVAAGLAQAQEKRIEVHATAGHAIGGDIQFLGPPMHWQMEVVKGSPYAAEAVSETVQTLANGNRITRKNTTQIYRDSEGRTRREDTLGGVGPWAVSGSTKQFISINDPTTSVSYTLDPDEKTARKMTMPASGSAPVNVMSHFQMPVPAVAAAPGEAIRMEYRAVDAGTAKKESLGKKVIEGVLAEGSRTTMTIPAGQIGNEQPIDVVSERWYSDDLKTTVYSKNSDPRFGETTFRLSDIRQAEQPRYLFDVPPDYKVVEGPGPGMMRFDRGVNVRK